MEPTNAEIIFYAVLAVIGLIFVIGVMSKESYTIDITQSKRRDWERREKEWYK